MRRAKMGCNLSFMLLKNKLMQCDDCGVRTNRGPFTHEINCRKNSIPQCTDCGHYNERGEIHVCC